jgi:hypothetical protein
MGIDYGQSWVAIANRALGRLGKGRIDNLDTGSELSQYVNTFLGEAIAAVLSARSWSFAKREQLVRIALEPAYGYLYAYQLPSDIINLVAVDTGIRSYRPEGALILTDAETVYITYIPKPADPGNLPEYIKTAIATHLAFLLTPPLTSNEQMAARIMQDKVMSLEEAVRADARRFESGAGESWYDEAR